MKKILFFIFILTLINCKSSWVKTNERIFKKINRKSILISQFQDVESKNNYFKTKLYKSEKLSALKSEFFYDTLMQSKSEFYLKDSLILKYKYYGLDALLYPENKKAYAKISEKIYFLKNNQDGILKEREIKIKSYSEFKKSLNDLKQKDFKTRQLKEKELIMIKSEYKSIIKKY